MNVHCRYCKLFSEKYIMKKRFTISLMDIKNCSELSLTSYKNSTKSSASSLEMNWSFFEDNQNFYEHLQTSVPTPTCRCCMRAASSVCTLSTSKRTGKANMTKEVPNIHKVDRVNLYTFLTPLMDAFVALPEKSRTLSGNISVRPHNLSAIVSSSKSSSSPSIPSID